MDSTINRAHQHAAGARIEGDLQKESPGGIGVPEPADHALGRSRGGWTTKLHLATERPETIVVAGDRQAAWIHRSSRRCWPGSGSPGFVVGEPGAGRIGFWRTRPTVLAPTGPICGGEGSRARFPSPLIRCGIAATAARLAADHQRSTRRSTSSGTRSNAASTGSNGTEASPHGSTNSRFVTRQLCTSRRSTSGYDIETGSSRHRDRLGPRPEVAATAGRNRHTRDRNAPRRTHRRRPRADLDFSQPIQLASRAPRQRAITSSIVIQLAARRASQLICSPRAQMPHAVTFRRTAPIYAIRLHISMSIKSRKPTLPRPQILSGEHPISPLPSQLENQQASRALIL